MGGEQQEGSYMRKRLGLRDEESIAPAARILGETIRRHTLTLTVISWPKYPTSLTRMDNLLLGAPRLYPSNTPYYEYPND